MDVEMVKANSYPHVSFHVLNFACPANQQYSAHVDVKENLLAINNLHNSIDLYSIPNMQLIKTYSHGNANNAIFKVSFVDRDWLVPGGAQWFCPPV